MKNGSVVGASTTVCGSVALYQTDLTDADWSPGSVIERFFAWIGCDRRLAKTSKGAIENADESPGEQIRERKEGDDGHTALRAAPT